MRHKLKTKLKSSNPPPPELHLPTRGQVENAFQTLSKKSGRAKFHEGKRFERVFKIVYLSASIGLILLFFLGMATLERCS